MYTFFCIGGVHDCWDVYRRIRASNGRVLGMNLVPASDDEQPIKIAIAGDSAGGNLAAVVTLKVSNNNNKQKTTSNRTHKKQRNTHKIAH